MREKSKMSEDFKLKGFDESLTGPEVVAPDTIRRGNDRAALEQAERIGADAKQERNANDQDRRRNDIVVDRRLLVLKAHAESLHGTVTALDARITSMEPKVDKISSSMEANNEMTKQILAITSGLSIIVKAVKWAGGMCVPVTAIYGLYYLISHGHLLK